MSLKDFQQTTALGPDALFMLEGATFDTSPGGRHRPKQIVVNALPLTKVPVAMRRMGWHTSAALMQRWFDSPGWEMPEAWKTHDGHPAPLGLSNAHCDESIVKMSWAMGYERCRAAVKVAESRLTTPNAVQRLRNLLGRLGWREGDVVSLGSISHSAREMDAFSQLNFTTFGSTEDPLDDMYGALGEATLKVGVVGQTFTRQNSVTGKIRNYFKVEHAGFYIRDNYDFNGIQFLGIWTEDKVLTRSEMLRAATPSGQSIYKWATDEFALVRNGHFRGYRAKTRMGGDYVIYSDILWRKLDRTIDLDILP